LGSKKYGLYVLKLASGADFMDYWTFVSEHCVSKQEGYR